MAGGETAWIKITSLIKALDDLIFNINISMNTARGMTKNLIPITRIVSANDGHTFNEIPPSTAPSIKLANGTVAVPASSMAFKAILGMKWSNPNNTTEMPSILAIKGGVIQIFQENSNV